MLFVDEIHRFNKAQQDAFLPHVEAGTIMLVGATTENPSFEVNSALLSRAQGLRPAAARDGRRHVASCGRALADHERGLGTLQVVADDGGAHGASRSTPTATRASRSTCSNRPSWRSAGPTISGAADARHRRRSPD